MEAAGSTCSTCSDLGFNFESTACGLCGMKINAAQSLRGSRTTSTFPNDQSIIVHPSCGRKVSALTRIFRNQVDDFLRRERVHLPDKDSLHSHVDHALMVAFKAMRPYFLEKSVVAYFESDGSDLTQTVGLQAVQEYVKRIKSVKAAL